MAEPRLTQIHIADNKTDEILDFIPESDFWNDERIRSLTDNRDTFDFETFATETYSGALEERNRIIIPNKHDDSYSEFIIEEAAQIMDDSGLHYKATYTTASYLELRKQKQIAPQTILAQSPEDHIEFALEGTEWQKGDIAYAPNHTTTLTAYMDAYSYLQNVAAWSGMELRFRVEHNGIQITGRYVDLVDRSGTWRGHEAVFGKDLLSIERRRKFDAVITALIGLGPDNDDGSPQEEVYVESDAALARWGRNGKHLVEVFTPQSEDQNINPEKLLELTQEELNRRISHQSEYVATIATLADVLDVDAEDLQFGDVIRIKDEEFNPPIYLEARVHEMKESIKVYGDSTVTLGDFTEFSEDEVKSILKRLQASLADKISNAELVAAIESVESAKRLTQPTPPDDLTAIWVDNSDRPLITKIYIDAVEGWVPIMPATAEEIGADPLGSADTALAFAREDIVEVTNELDAFRNEYNEFMSDGFISRSEALSIERHLNAIAAEKADIDADYTATYGNSKLVDKAPLLSAKQAYDTAHNSLVNTITTAIADSYATPTEAAQVDDAFVAYATALGNYSTARANAANAITSQSAGDAQSAAEEFASVVAREAQEAAEGTAAAYAAAQAEYARLEAIAYADGLITNEEQARLDHAAAQLEIAKAYAEEAAATAVDAIDNSDLATKEEVAEQGQAIRDQLSTRGGANLLRNSIGYANMDFWQYTTTSMTVSTMMNEALKALGFGSGFYFPADGAVKGIQQAVNVTEGDTYTLGWYLQKAAEGTFLIEVLDGTTVIASATDISVVGGAFAGSYLTFTATASTVTIRFTAASTVDATLTGLMLGAGNLPTQWTLSTGELYNAYVRADERGLQVLRLDENGNVEGSTIMSPEEFAGYYGDERVFWLNKDETVTKKIRALNEITMGTIKIVRVESALNRGWAFVPIIPEDL
jgi:phage minor structural protein